jgi:hypothetical protein
MARGVAWRGAARPQSGRHKIHRRASPIFAGEVKTVSGQKTRRNDAYVNQSKHDDMRPFLTCRGHDNLKREN